MQTKIETDKSIPGAYVLQSPESVYLTVAAVHHLRERGICICEPSSLSPILLSFWITLSQTRWSAIITITSTDCHQRYDDNECTLNRVAG